MPVRHTSVHLSPTDLVTLQAIAAHLQQREPHRWATQSAVIRFALDVAKEALDRQGAGSNAE